MLPPAGGSSPSKVRSSVVLPLPFGPTMPIRSPSVRNSVSDSIAQLQNRLAAPHHVELE
jgi:hypothetical protein